MNGYSRFPAAVTVGELNEYIKALIDSNEPLCDVYVKGEISNFKNHYSTGHYYFSLKDESSNLRAVMFRSYTGNLLFQPEDGMQVIAHGRISAYVRDGQYQLYVDAMQPDGAGSLAVAFEQLKRRLAAEGLFDEERKKPLPKLPTTVGLISSATGAAVRDMIHVTGRRFPLAKIVLYPALVQGLDAPSSLIAGLAYFNRTKSCDVIIIGRGGGSMEDLWCFNDEGLARAVARSAIPVISAVGHETDFTICDFVADLRAPTPSAAAELAVPDARELHEKFDRLITRERAILTQLVSSRREGFDYLASSRVLRHPETLIEAKRLDLDAAGERLVSAGSRSLTDAKTKLASVTSQLESLSPLAVLSRGYTITTKDDGTTVRYIADVAPGDQLTVYLPDGSLHVTADEILPENPERKDL